MVKVLFVCLGNICRSPTAEGVFRRLVQEEGADELIAGIDSAGTGGWHAGDPPDPRARKAALQRGIDLSHMRARKVRMSDYAEFDYLLAMDEDNFHTLLREAPDERAAAKIFLFLNFAPSPAPREVPDPYYGGAEGFEHMLDLIEAAAGGLLSHIRGTIRVR